MDDERPAELTNAILLFIPLEKELMSTHTSKEI